MNIYKKYTNIYKQKYKKYTKYTTTIQNIIQYYIRMLDISNIVDISKMLPEGPMGGPDVVAGPAEIPTHLKIVHIFK